MQCNIISLAQLQGIAIPGATVSVEDILPDHIMLFNGIFLQAGLLVIGNGGWSGLPI